jgi:hypothetical protein
MPRYNHCMRLLLALAVAIALLSISACPKRIHQASPAPGSTPAQQEANVPPPTPHVYFIFVPPPPDPLVPERDVFTSEFSLAAKDAFANANWSYREVKLYEHPMNEWAQVMTQEINSFPTVIFTYHGSYTALFTEMASRSEVPAASYVLTLTTVKSGESPLIKVLEPRMEELGFVAGAALARVSQTAHLATVTLKDYEGDRFVAGFFQGLQEERGSASHSAIYMDRSDLIGAQDSAAFIAGKLGDASKKFTDGRAIDSVALFIGPLAQPFIDSQPPDTFFAVTGPAPLDIPEHGVVTSCYMDFGKIPQYLIEHAEDLKLFTPKGANTIRKGADSRMMPNIGNIDLGTGVQYVSVGLAEGILNYTGLAQFARKHQLPRGLEADIERYIAAIKSGEIKVTQDKPQ